MTRILLMGGDFMDCDGKSELQFLENGEFTWVLTYLHPKGLPISGGLIPRRREFCDVLCDITPPSYPLQTPPMRANCRQQENRKV
jgi:hypothetical protein